jgi:putative transposase
MDKFQDFYRIPSIRLQNWDYGWNASCFVTIYTSYKENYFGEIRDVEMILSPPGIIAEKYWSEIPQHFPYVLLDAFVVMPCLYDQYNR